MNPFLEIGVRKGLGAPEFFPESYRLGPFGTPQADVNVGQELVGLGAGLPGMRALGAGQGGGTSTPSVPESAASSAPPPPWTTPRSAAGC